MAQYKRGKKHMKLQGIDKVLTPFYRLHFKHGLMKTVRYTIHLFYKPEKYINANANNFKKFIYRIFSYILGFILTLLLIPLYLIVYVTTIVLTFIPVSIIVVGLGLFYGLLPFVIKLDKRYTPKIKNKVVDRKGLDVLLVPLTWGGMITKKVVENFYQLGLNPSRKMKELQENTNKQYVKQMGLGMASVISYVVYSLLVFSIFEITSFFTLSVIALLSLILWSVLVLFVKVLPKLFSDREFEDEEK